MRIGVSVGPDWEQVSEVPERFDFVETSIGEMEVPVEEIDMEQLESMLEERDFGLVVHLPFRQPLATGVEELDSANRKYLERLLAWCNRAGAEKAVVHVDLRWNAERDERREDVERQIQMLMEAGRRKQVEVTFENLPFEESKVAELEEFGEIMEDLEAPICFDTGHAYVEKDQEALEQFLKDHLDQVSHLHLQDSNGGDDHLAPGHGEIDWEALGDVLSRFKGTATLEVFSDDYRFQELSLEILEESLGQSLN